MQEIYFDNSATTQVCAEAAAVAMQAMLQAYGNPSSLHKKGLAAEKILKEARRDIAATLQAEPEEIIFTGGGTESDNLAIQGIATAYASRGRHIITSAVEHPAVLDTCKQLEQKGYQLTILPVDDKGRVSIKNLKDALRPNTILVSLMLVNNETGSIQPVEEAGRLLAKQSHKIFFHVDAIQAYGKMPITPKNCGINLLSASGHKIHGPKGVGFLYVRKGTRLKSIVQGGGQEQNIRSGTENVPGIAAFAIAAKIACGQMKERKEQVYKVKQAFLSGLKDLPNIHINSPEDETGSEYLVNISFLGTKSEILLHCLEARGLYVSSGSACAAKSDTLSYVLLAMGLEREVIEGAIRFSFSPNNTEEEAKNAAAIVVEEVQSLRQILKGK